MSEVLKPLTDVSKSVNGYVELPGGLIFQWGTRTINNGPENHTLPIPFPTEHLNINCSARPGGTPDVMIGQNGLAGFTTESAVAQTINWFAVGY